MAGEAKYEKKKIIVGDFIFGLEGSAFTNRWKWIWNKEEISEEYDKLAMRMMNLHNEFYDQFKNREIEEYVTTNAHVYCEKGHREQLLDKVISHGVDASNKQAVLTCKDCDFTEDLRGCFGECDIDHSAFKIPGIENRRIWTKSANSCFPILEQEWKQKEGDLAIAEDETGEVFVDALRIGAYLVCMYGGQIRVKDIPDKPEEEEEEDDFDLIDGWLRLYKEQTIPGEGRFVQKHKYAKNWDWAMPEELDGSGNPENAHSETWFQNESPASKDIRGKGGNFIVNQTSNNLYTDGEGRYWVAVGPNVVNPSHSLEKVDHDIYASEVFYGTKMDVEVEHQDTGERYYVRVVNGDAKEHSYRDGLYQTGDPFNKNRPKQKIPKEHSDPFDPQNPTGNTVEFIGYHITEKTYEDGDDKSSINVTNNYRLIGIYVYDGEFNYG